MHLESAHAVEVATGKEWFVVDGAIVEELDRGPYRGSLLVSETTGRGVVHTVVGCTLAEFATVSTDMVDRLHDQNEGRSIPTEFTRAYAESRLRAIRWPAASRYVHIAANGVTQSPIGPEPITGGMRTTFGRGAVMAAACSFARGMASEIATDQLGAPDPPLFVVVTGHRVVQHELHQTVGVAGRESGRDPEAVPCEHDDVLHPRRVDDGAQVVGPLVEDRALEVGRRIRETDPAAIEDHHPPDLSEPFEQPLEARVALERLHREHPARHHHDVVRVGAVQPGVEHLVRDVGAVGGAGVLDLGHGP